MCKHSDVAFLPSLSLSGRGRASGAGEGPNSRFPPLLRAELSNARRGRSSARQKRRSVASGRLSICVLASLYQYQSEAAIPARVRIQIPNSALNLAIPAIAETTFMADDNLRRDRARQLRRAQTDAEKKLWDRLKGGQLNGVKFRRQFPIGPFFADFCAPRESLVVELDGAQHLDMLNRDQRRTELLESLGYRVVRFWDNDALASTDEVIEKISALLKDSLVLRRPRSGGASPPGRGVFRASR